MRVAYAGEFNGRRLYTELKLDYRLSLWAAISAWRAISAPAEVLVSFDNTTLFSARMKSPVANVVDNVHVHVHYFCHRSQDVQQRV